MARGTVAWFDAEKGHGVISPDSGGEGLFVHFSFIVTDGYRVLSEGQAVEYEVGHGTNGPQAERVRSV